MCQPEHDKHLLHERVGASMLATDSDWMGQYHSTIRLQHYTIVTIPPWPTTFLSSTNQAYCVHTIVHALCTLCCSDLNP